MHLFITGGTGLIGSALINMLLKQGHHQITILTRNKAKAEKNWGNRISYCTSLGLIDTLSGYDGVINLAGEPIIGKPWSLDQKERLCNSRWNITKRLTELIKISETPPQVFISGSAVGYYGKQKDNIVDEKSTPHNEFTHQLCKTWEELALEAQSEKTRVCISRTGIVLAKEGGMLSMLTLPFRLGLGCSLSNGSQYISWIHIQDMLNAIMFLLNTPEAQGCFNLTAPNPVTNKRFSKILSATLYRPCLFRMPAFAIKLLLGESSTMVLDGQRVIPKRLLDLHFRFMYEHLDDALNSLLKGKKKY